MVKLIPATVVVNSVTDTIDQIHPEFIRINGWPGFLKGSHLEAAALGPIQKKSGDLVNAGMVFVADEPGFVSARIVAMIINEAFFTWEAGTSSKEEIDIAMKLGTGYPYGPFEWAGMIGLVRVYALLKRLAGKNSDYEIAKGLLDRG
jgi:3-hydroxybutyryl-CoA dehydrogenase